MVPSIVQAVGETFWIANGGEETSSSPAVCDECLCVAHVSSVEVYSDALRSLSKIFCEAKATVNRY